MPENSDIKVLALVGSLRAASINRQIAELAAAVAPDGVTVTVFEGLGDLPFYNEEIDDAITPDVQPPAQVVALRSAAAESDAALVVTPEYNGSIPAVVKNAIDWLSRPFGNGALKDKPLAVIGGSMGQIRRGMGARRHPQGIRNRRRTRGRCDQTLSAVPNAGRQGTCGPRRAFGKCA